MENNITRDDLDVIIEFLKQDDPILTQSTNVKAFEEEWSKWLGVKYSVFVNSGASANLITLAALKEKVGTGEIILPPLTWSSDVSSVIHNNFTPVFADINPKTLCMDEEQIIKKITTKTKAVFMTYVQGFNGLSDSLLNHLDSLGIPLIEDVCESHGASHNGKKLGAFGLMSNFSFYYAHHMSTIEGGMISTDNEEYYQILRMLRSHGMVREATNEQLKLDYAQDKNQLNPEFIFAYQAYNVRNTEIGAILGRNQLKRLDEIIQKRTDNLHIFLENLDEKRFRMDFATEGSSNYAFNFVLNSPDFDLRDRLEKVMREAGIEFRRGSAGGGNQLRQPYLSEYIEDESWKNFPETEHIHHFCWYVGNYPTLEEEKILTLCEILNSA
tara:strand:+ start:9555 stop:10706 length:1152 start_codon:yes stop_codon:yes gene_type:complete